MAEGGGFWDSVGNVLGDVFGTSGKDGKDGWLGQAGSWIKDHPEVISVGAGLYDAYNQNKQNKDIRDIYQQAEDQNYQQSQANYDAYRQWAEGESARRRADAGARAHAARINQQRQLEAMAQAQEQMDKTRKRTMSFLKPYVRAGREILPGQIEARLAGQDMAQDLVGKIQNQQAVRPQDILMPIPDYLGR